MKFWIWIILKQIDKFLQNPFVQFYYSESFLLSRKQIFYHVTCVCVSEQRKGVVKWKKKWNEKKPLFLKVISWLKGTSISLHPIVFLWKSTN